MVCIVWLQVKDIRLKRRVFRLSASLFLFSHYNEIVSIEMRIFYENFAQLEHETKIKNKQTNDWNYKQNR